MLAQREPRVDQVLDRREVQIVEPRDLSRDERLIGQIGERRPAPERERSGQQCASATKVAFDGGLSCRRQGGLESVDVDGLGWHQQAITVAVCLENLAPERLPQPRYVSLQRLGRGRSCVLAPELLDQPVGRDHLAAVEEKQRQESALLVAAERDRLAVADHFQWA